MDPVKGAKVAYVQFPQRFDGVDRSDRYANHNTVFYDVNMKGLDGIQGPMYVGTGCCFRRQVRGVSTGVVQARPLGQLENCNRFRSSTLKQGTPGCLLNQLSALVPCI
jgi:hypothetical protein